MNRSTLTTISKICLVFAIVWFVGLIVLEVHYVFSVLREEAHLRHYHLLRLIYEEQIEGINFILVIIFLIPGVFAWFMHIRFRQEHCWYSIGRKRTLMLPLRTNTSVRCFG